MSRALLDSADATTLLAASRAGRAGAADALFEQLYGELRRLARARLAGPSVGETLNTTGLVHEAYLRLVAPERVTAVDRAHFLALAARAMRYVVLDAPAPAPSAAATARPSRSTPCRWPPTVEFRFFGGGASPSRPGGSAGRFYSRRSKAVTRPRPGGPLPPGAAAVHMQNPTGMMCAPRLHAKPAAAAG